MMKSFAAYGSVLAYAGSPLNIPEALKRNYYDFLAWLKYEKARTMAEKRIEKIKE